MDKKKCKQGCNMTSSEKVLLADLAGKTKERTPFWRSEKPNAGNGTSFLSVCLCAENTAKIVNYPFYKNYIWPLIKVK